MESEKEKKCLNCNRLISIKNFNLHQIQCSNIGGNSTLGTTMENNNSYNDNKINRITSSSKKNKINYSLINFR
jgi:hypothetical protein